MNRHLTSFNKSLNSPSNGMASKALCSLCERAQTHAGAVKERSPIWGADEEPFGLERRTCRPSSTQIHSNRDQNPGSDKTTQLCSSSINALVINISPTCYFKLRKYHISDLKFRDSIERKGEMLFKCHGAVDLTYVKTI